MILKKLLIENLRSYEKQEVDFPKGSVLLSGDIGSGKTTILMAIEFALFGLQPSQKGNSLLRSGTDNAKVILEFDVEDQQVVIERCLKRGKKSISQEYATVTIDDEKFEGSVTEVKDRILRLLNYPLEFSKKTNLLYKYTVYTPQEEMKQIIMEPGEIRLNVLRHVFGIDKYKRIEENTSILTSRLREKIRINEGMVYDLEDHKSLLNQKKQNFFDSKEKQNQAILEYKKLVVERETKEKSINEIQEKINDKRSLENEKSKSLILISEKNQQIIGLKNNIHNLKIQIDEAKKSSFNVEEFNSLNERIKFQESKEEDIQKEYIQIIGKINSEESRKKELEILQIKLTGLHKCPTCLQEVTEDYKKNILYKTTDEIASSKNSMENLLKLKKDFSDQLDSIKRIKEELKSKKSDLELLKIKMENILEKKNRVLDIEQQKQLLEKDVELLSKHVRTIEISISEFSKYDSQFEVLNKELILAKKSENNSAIKLAEINKEIQLLEIQIKEKEQEINKKEDLKKKIEKIREIEYWISEKFINLVLFTEKQVMLRLKEEFSKLFSKWFSILVSETLSAKLDEDFSPIIEQQDYELDYSFLSGGERTAIALAYRLSLNQVINSLLSNIKTRNLVILDEPTDGFSSQQLDKMQDVLNQLSIDQLILVSHEQKIEGFVDNIIRLSKENNITKVG